MNKLDSTSVIMSTLGTNSVINSYPEEDRIIGHISRSIRFICPFFAIEVEKCVGYISNRKLRPAFAFLELPTTVETLMRDFTGVGLPVVLDSTLLFFIRVFYILIFLLDLASLIGKPSWISLISMLLCIAVMTKGIPGLWFRKKTRPRLIRKKSKKSLITTTLSTLKRTRDKK